MRLLAAVLLSTLTITLSGCAIPGRTSFAVSSLSMATLSKNNYRVIKADVTGESTGFYFLFIPFVWPTVSEAKHDLYDKLYAQGIVLEGRAIALTNTTEDRGGYHFLLFGIPKVKLTADVIEFIPGSGTDSPNEIPPQSLHSK